MRRQLISAIGAGCAYLLAHCALGAEIPQALSSTGPAVVGFDNHLVAAWTGDTGSGPHKVWYSTFGSEWSPQKSVPASSTRVAPALATVNQLLYLATTGTDEKIYYYVSQSGTFDDNREPLCDGGTCAQTLAAPALTANGSTLYSAWTTPSGSIRYGHMKNGTWTIGAALPFESAITKPSTAPSLAVYLGRLFIAWVSPEDNAIWVASTALPLTSTSWSEPPTKVSANTTKAPALAVLLSDDSTADATDVLYLSWTTPKETLKFDRLDSLFGVWVPTTSPVALPEGTLTPYTPALTNCVLDGPVTSAADVDSAAAREPETAAKASRYNVIAVTRPDAAVDIFCGQHPGPTK